MAKGLTEEEATTLIIRGFLDIGIEGIGDELKAEIDKVISKSQLGL